MRTFLGVVATCLLAAPSVLAQTIEINRQNRTIEIVVSERIQVDPDLANVTLGCITHGQTHDQAYQTNLAIADKVIKALLGSGLAKSQIEGSSIELSEANSGDSTDHPPAARKARQFKALQRWHIRVPTSNAQKLIDLAVQAGANGVEDVSWDVSDAEALESKARIAAMGKARTIASEMAKSSGDKLGGLLYASNVLSGLMSLVMNRTALGTSSASLSAQGNGFPTPTFSLQLFPGKVEKQATVRVVFALE
jgi:uncharacterized protein YggE